MPCKEDVVFLDLDGFPFTLKKLSFTDQIQVYIVLDVKRHGVNATWLIAKFG
jgi:hypothetical protein